MLKSIFARISPLVLTIGVLLAATSAATPARAVEIHCNGNLKVWSQPSGRMFLIFFKNIGNVKRLNVFHDFGQRGQFGLPRGQTFQIRARTDKGTIDCR